MNDTIAAIATPLGKGAISIVRLSGNDSINIINKIFTKNLTEEKSHTVHYGFIKDNNETVDEVLVSIMKSPNTFTGEDTIEINCHGGSLITKEILDLILETGARLAEPGEFTKRAFLNGRKDLLEAESVMDIIEAKTKSAASLALNGLNGKISNKIRNLRDKVFNLIGTIEVNIDYPEYDDVEVLTNEKILPNIESILNEIKETVNEAKTGEIIKEGIKTVIVGAPNVGKSSLLNKLINEDKAIVTDIPGTTRDIVEGEINLNGVLLKLVDTAGIRETQDIVEQLGVEKTLNELNGADLVLLILDGSKELSIEEFELINKIKTNKIIVLNKQDLEEKINVEDLNNEIIVKVSAITENGIEELKQKIVELFNLEKIETKDLSYLSNSRQIDLIKKACKHLEFAKESILNKKEIDLVEIDLKEVWTLLGEITGDSYSEKLIDDIFKKFCLGK